MTTIGLPTSARGVEADHTFWRNMLLAGGYTAVPRWSLDPIARIAQHEAMIRDDLVTALHRLADELAVSFSSVLLAAHAKVFAALSGEPETMTGYVAVPGGEPLPCRLTTESDSWRALLLDTHRVGSHVLAHKDFPIDDLRHELGLTGSPFEMVFDPMGPFEPAGSLDPTGSLDPIGSEPSSGSRRPGTNPLLWLGICPVGSRYALRLRYRTDVLDAECAARIVGYHLTALRLIAEDAEADHRRQSLLSTGEVRFQLEGLAGPHRELPDRRVHELFQDQVLAHPDAVAAVHGGQRWTYAQLNSRANQLGRSLLAQGLQREGVVAVVTERNLDWMAAVLAVFKAGGVYLPIEPHFPADRIATTLSRAGCSLVLTEPGSSTTLDQALDTVSGVRKLDIGTACAQGHADEDLGVPVSPDQLAYIYFTSGSTGEPKGAMCEHAGMLNHILAKVDDLGIGEDGVVAQIAPQCFDISLWQLVGALVVGGRTVIVEQEAILDVQRFIDTITDARVTVLQVVPSYLEVVLSYLEQNPRELPDLRHVSATGEALKKELTQRWFAAMPKSKLVNAYGLTETSDDTNHEVMDQVPARDRVPLGPCVSNVHVYVVDENLSLVPLGAPGLIVFSGVCVGRGYVNDPERTRQAYLTDPYREGSRLYRGGDYGRWLPEGKLEFLGRRDNQVKIAGFRIEIGEIENRLLQVPGVRDGAVVVSGKTHQPRHLVAFYAGPGPLAAETLRGGLGESLPEYMIPTAFHWRERLPLTANSKIDRKALTGLAGELAHGDGGYEAPRTATERRLAAAWATVLGRAPDRIGRRDHFFDSGGTSLGAVRLAIALDRKVSLRDLVSHPVLAELGALIDGRSQRPTGLLQSLSGPDFPSPGPDSLSGPDSLTGPDGSRNAGAPGALVCFPYAGGNAVNFHQLAAALRGSGLAVYAVELPGHDLTAEGEPFAPLADVVEHVVAEIIRRGLTRVLLWGHSSGTAFALETARALTAQGVAVPRVFLAAQLIGDAAQRRTAITELTGRTDGEIATALSTDGGYTELGELSPQQFERLGAAYRHDSVSAHRYLTGILECPPEQKLPIRITVVVAADDPSTAPYRERYRDWELVADRVDLHELADGGHYFLRSRPLAAAQAVLPTAESPASTRVMALVSSPAVGPSQGCVPVNHLTSS